MLHAYPSDPHAGEPLDPAALSRAVWIDLVDPTEAEIAAVQAAVGLRPPTRQSVSEIEATSRLKIEDDALYMSAPLVSANNGEDWSVAPTGFVLSRNVCLTVRFARLAAFEAVGAEVAGVAGLQSSDAFIRLLEEVVDRAADHLEGVAEALNSASHAIFPDQNAKSHLSKDTRQLRRVMIQIGRTSERMSQARYTLVCLSRMAQFAKDRGRGIITHANQVRLNAVCADIASLEQFEENMLGRVQLLQDAAVGFISIEQNEVVKVLTIASVVGVPPVLVVGIYGMNFRFMPELAWRYGYAYALALIVVSTVIPLAWFKLKDWM